MLKHDGIDRRRNLDFHADAVIVDDVVVLNHARDTHTVWITDGILRGELLQMNAFFDVNEFVMADNQVLQITRVREHSRAAATLIRSQGKRGSAGIGIAKGVVLNIDVVRLIR